MANGLVTINSEYFKGSGDTYTNIQAADVWYASYDKLVGDMLARDHALLSVLQNRMDNDPTILALQEGNSRVVQPDGGQGGAFHPQIQVNALARRRATIAGFLWSAFGNVVAGNKVATGTGQMPKHTAETHLMLYRMGWALGGEDVLSALKGNLGDFKRNEALYGIYGIVLSSKYNGLTMESDNTHIAYGYYTRVFNQYQTFDGSKKWK